MTRNGNTEFDPANLFSELLDELLGQILQHEDAAQLIDWLTERLARRDMLAIFDIDGPDDTRALAQSLGRSLWNVTPLPGNGFRPRPLPEPRRNDACPCGSGRKFKRCCMRVPPPRIEPEMIWTVLLTRLPAMARRNAIRSGNAPVHSLIGLALEHEQAGAPKKALGLVEPLFEGALHGHDADYDYALNLVCNLYDELGYWKKKQALLERIVNEARRSPLRSGALQRLAAIRLDEGDASGAWKAFEAAQRDDPKSPSIGLLEVQLLVAEGRRERARERAQFWVKRLQRSGVTEEKQGILEFLKAVATDPGRAIAEVGFAVSGEAGRALGVWLDDVAERPLPAYLASLDEPGNAAGGSDQTARLRSQLRQQGIPEREIGRAVAQLSAELQRLQADAPEIADDSEESDEHPPASVVLEAPRQLVSLESEWQAVCPVDKPFSVHMVSGGGKDAWDTEDVWMAFLRKHREAFDSLDILDDLATIVEGHPMADVSGLRDTLQEPLLRRARAIVESAIGSSTIEDPKLPWRFAPNRPAIRSLVRLAYLELDRGNDASAVELAHRVLALNPDDNHGLRTLVINSLLRNANASAALALARRYPRDINPDIAFGEVLALYRLGRKGDALLAFEDAIRRFPKVPRYLTAARVRKPKIDAHGVQIGGDDQAWIYREEMRDVWEATPGMLDWLKKAASRHR